MSEQQNKVWGVFVGENGNQLEAFNSKKGPFPPKLNTEGYIAIGWPAVGDMNLYENDYADYRLKINKVYKDRTVAALNIPWNFAFEMQENDWVISPSATTGYLLVGKIIGSYIPDFHNEFGFYKITNEVYLHLRKVQWLYVVPKEDVRYSKLNKIGMLTVSQSRFSIEELKYILNDSISDSWSDTLKEETRNVLKSAGYGDFVPRDEFVHMKNFNDNFGTILVTDWINRKWLIKNKKTDAEYLYTTIDELIASGWAVD